MAGNRDDRNDSRGGGSLKKLFSLATMGLLATTVLGGGAYQFTTTHNEYKQLPDGYPFGYPGYAIVETISDGIRGTGWAMDNASYYLAKFFNLGLPLVGREKIPVAEAFNHVIPVCVPDSLVNQGWYDPAPGGKMDQYRHAAQMYAWHTARDRLVAGSRTRTGIYEGKNIAVFVDAAIGNWTPAGKRPNAEVRIIEGPVSDACKAPGFSGREGFTVTGIPQKVPLLP